MNCYLGASFCRYASGNKHDLIQDYWCGKSRFIQNMTFGKEDPRGRLRVPLQMLLDESDQPMQSFVRIKQVLHNIIEEISSKEKNLYFDAIYISRVRLKSISDPSTMRDYEDQTSSVEFVNWIKNELSEFGFLNKKCPIVLSELSCVSGISILDSACKKIQFGLSKRVLLISFDLMTPIAQQSLDSLGVLTRGNASDSPKVFHTNRDGFARAEAVAAVILSSERESACEYPIKVLGARVNCDASALISMDTNGEGLFRCIKDLLLETKVSISEVSLIKAHGTGTKINDAVEVQVLFKLFKQKIRTIPTISFKSQFGHTLNASAIFELIILSEILQKNKLQSVPRSHPTDFDNYLLIPQQLIEREMQIVLGLGVGFGGFNGAYLLEKEIM